MESRSRRIKGRGTDNESSPRYLEHSRQPLEDAVEFEEESVSVKTTIMDEVAKSIISSNSSPDVPFELSINPYRGCEHGCSYCYARPSHAYLDLSPGLDFETRIIAKHNAAEKLLEELAAPSYECKPIALGSNTDPYQPVEKKLGITRRIIEVLAKHSHPLTIVTKSYLVQRDMDLLADMAKRNLVQVFISVTTLDAKLANRLEPRASSPFRRVETIEKLVTAGIPTGLLLAPVIPAVNDMEIEDILRACAEAGANTAGYVLLRLPLEVREIFIEWLDKHMPMRKEHVMNIVRDIRSGKDYDSSFHSRMSGTGVFASLIANRFNKSCKELKLDRKRISLDCSLFEAPQLPGTQQTLF